MRLQKCGTCNRDWPWVGEQAACVELIGHCIVCQDEILDGAFRKDTRIMNEWIDENGIIIETNRRQKETGYSIDPCPRCLHRRDKECIICQGLGCVKVDVSEKSKPVSAGNGGDDE